MQSMFQRYSFPSVLLLNQAILYNRALEDQSKQSALKILTAHVLRLFFT